jgi:hypothetical protein
MGLYVHLTPRTTEVTTLKLPQREQKVREGGAACGFFTSLGHPSSPSAQTSSSILLVSQGGSSSTSKSSNPLLPTPLNRRERRPQLPNRAIIAPFVVVWSKVGSIVRPFRKCKVVPKGGTMSYNHAPLSLSCNLTCPPPPTLDHTCNSPLCRVSRDTLAYWQAGTMHEQGLSSNGLHSGTPLFMRILSFMCCCLLCPPPPPPSCLNFPHASVSTQANCPSVPPPPPPQMFGLLSGPFI